MKLFTIGCSFTEGQGLTYQMYESYTANLSKKINIPFYNYGLCSASNDYIFRKFFELIDGGKIKKEDIIILQWTHYDRKELPIIYQNKKWYHYPPSGYFPMWDKKLHKSNTVQNEYIGIELQKELYELKDKNSKLMDLYTFNFLHEEYQKTTTKNYINSVYTYLEHFGYNHLHFFGWDECIVDEVYQNKSKFLLKTFGEYTNTPNGVHPDKQGHLDWSNYLYEEITKLNYI